VEPILNEVILESVGIQTKSAFESLSTIVGKLFPMNKLLKTLQTLYPNILLISYWAFA